MKIIPIALSLLAVVVSSAGLDAQVISGAQPPNRAALEQQLRERVAQITRKRLGLDDSQMEKLQGVNARFAPQMRSLTAQERDTRQRLRGQLTAATPDQAEVARLLGNLFDLQKQRMTLLESEQKDLSAFLTPVQRAKYMGLQAQVRRRVDRLRAPNAGRPRGRARNRLPR